MYTQHLGMASGGQIVKRWARKIFQLPDDVGTAAFDYTVGWELGKGCLLESWCRMGLMERAGPWNGAGQGRAAGCGCTG